MGIIIDTNKCKEKCEVCVDVCPQDVLAMTEDGPQIVYPDECDYCGACAMECPVSVIELTVPLPLKFSVLRGSKAESIERGTS